MTGLYLAAGHGVQPNGVFDPGAQFGNVSEHTQNVLVVAACSFALGRSGYADVVLEANGGTNKDVNYVGSTRAANAAKAQYVIEVHHDAGATPDSGGGTSCLVWDGDAHSPSRALGQRLQNELTAALGLPDRGVVERKDLYLLHHTTGLACIPEIAFVDGNHAWIVAHPDYVKLAGEALAKGFLGLIGHPYTPPGGRLWRVYNEHGAQVGAFADHTHVLGQVGKMLDGQARITITR